MVNLCVTSILVWLKIGMEALAGQPRAGMEALEPVSLVGMEALAGPASLEWRL